MFLLLGFNWALLAFTGFTGFVPGFIGLYRILLGFPVFLLGPTGFLLVYIGLYWVILGFTELNRVLMLFYWVLTVFYRVFTRLYLV